MKKKRFALLLATVVLFVLLASYFVAWFIDSGFYARITAIWVMAVFTIILALTTFWNGKITRALLKQTRQAFEIDTFNKIVSSGSQLSAELRDTKNFPQEERPDYVENFAVGMLVTLKNIDPTMFERIGEAIKTWNKTDNRTPATTYLNALNKIKEYQKIEKKELNKCEK